MAELIAQMEHGQLCNERLEQLVLELAERLHNTQARRCTATCRPKPKHWWTPSWTNWQRTSA